MPADTPGAQPKVYDEVLVAGSDGMPRLYKMHREVKREIGDDSNKIREYEAMPGRVSAVAFNADGTKFAAVSSLDGKGEVRVYDTDTGTKVVCEKVTGPAYAVAWHPDGKLIAVRRVRRHGVAARRRDRQAGQRVSPCCRRRRPR